MLVSAEFAAGSHAASHRSHDARAWVCVWRWEAGPAGRGRAGLLLIAIAGGTTSSASRGALRTSVSLRVHTWRWENKALPYTTCPWGGYSHHAVVTMVTGVELYRAALVRGGDVPLLRRVFTRIGSTDCLESCTSTFASEMRETTYVLRNLGKPSLVLVDELGRGTSNRDGSSLAWAIAEALALTPGTFTLFATHYLQLANLRNLYPSHVRNLVLDVEHSQSRLHFTYTVKVNRTTLTARPST